MTKLEEKKNSLRPGSLTDQENWDIAKDFGSLTDFVGFIMAHYGEHG